MWELGGRWVGADGGDSGTVIRGSGGVGGVCMGGVALGNGSSFRRVAKGFSVSRDGR